NDGTGVLSGEIVFDPAVVSVGNCAINPAIGPGTATEKTLGTNVVEPGRDRWLVFGLNLNIIPNGTLFTCEFTALPDAAPGVSPLTPENTVAANLQANAVPLAS